MSQPVDQIAITWEMATRFFAITGFALGILNAAITFVRGRRRYKVKSSVDIRSTHHGSIKIEVINHGTLPVTISAFFLTRRSGDGGPPPRVPIDVDRSQELPLTIAAGTAEAFSSKVKENVQAIRSGNDIVCVRAADGMEKTSPSCKDLTQYEKW